MHLTQKAMIVGKQDRKADVIFEHVVWNHILWDPKLGNIRQIN